VGGLICVNALLQVDNLLLEYLFPQIGGILFFGTPFMEASDHRWREMVVNISKLASPQRNNSTTSQADFHLDCVHEIINVFTHGIVAQRLFLNRVSLVYFCESLVMDRLGVGGYVLDEDAAVPSLEGEDGLGTATCIEADHILLCKYADASSDGYQRVREELQKIFSKLDKKPGSERRLFRRMRNVSLDWDLYRKVVWLGQVRYRN
jgi:hypothetical protein